MRDDLLPDKLSDLIDLAISDLEKCVAMPDTFTVDMSFWCVPHIGGKQHCAVCLAGSVMVQTLCGGKLLQERALVPSDFPEPVPSKLWALNFARQYRFADALDVLNLCDSDVLKKWRGIDRQFIGCARFTRDCPHVFCANMRRAAEMLREVGL